MQSSAVVFEAPREVRVRNLGLAAPGDDDVIVDVDFSGISTGTERLLWAGTMPSFPGLGYPLVPGYESVGRITAAGRGAKSRIGEYVFVPGSKGFEGARGLFGGAASRLVVPGARAMQVEQAWGEEAVLLALAATAYHALPADDAPQPDLIVGHGVLGRLLARLVVARGGAAPVVWELRPERRSGARGYDVVDPAADARRDYRSILDASGAPNLLDTLIGRLGRGGEIVLAGFYTQPLAFSFPPAFMREARLRIAAEWQPSDLAAVRDLVSSGQLSLSGLISDRARSPEAGAAYQRAFEDADCLKMILDWRSAA